MNPSGRRILYFAPIDPSLPLGHAAHVRSLCDALEARGWEIRLLCRACSRPLGWAGPSAGISFVPSSRIPRLGFALSEWRAGRMLRRECERFRPDRILVRLETLSFAPLLRRWPAPLWVESNAFLPGMLRLSSAGPLRLRIATRIERSLLYRADGIGVVSGRLADLLIESYSIPSQRVHLVPNGASLPALVPLDEIPALRRALGVADGVFVAGVIGNLSRLQGLSELLSICVRLGSESFVLWMIGEGTEEKRLRRESARLGLRNVRFVGSLSEGEAARHAQACQLLLAPYPARALRECGIDPLKVLHSMAADRPLMTNAPVPLAEFRAPDPEGPGLEAWAAAISRRIAEWKRAGCPNAGWPWPAGEGPGRAQISCSRTWDHTARAWETAWSRAGHELPSTGLGSQSTGSRRRR
jgi:glycosyltransferase involved in cell wall biosynthesis